jgi:hypothetical protein
MDRIRRAVIATGRAAVVLAMVTLAGCSTGHHTAVGSHLSLPPTVPAPILSPTPNTGPQPHPRRDYPTAARRHHHHGRDVSARIGFV